MDDINLLNTMSGHAFGKSGLTLVMLWRHSFTACPSLNYWFVYCHDIMPAHTNALVRTTAAASERVTMVTQHV